MTQLNKNRSECERFNMSEEIKLKQEYIKDMEEITLTTSKEFLDEMLAFMPEGEFRPYSWYDAESDTVTSYFADEDYYVKILNEDIEIFLDFEKHNVVGCRIIGVKNLMRPA